MNFSYMKTQILLCLLLLTVACSQKQTENTYKAMTYNIRYDNPDDGADNWHQRKAELTTQILKQAPDILGIQEGLAHQVTYLDSMLTQYAYVGVGREDGKTQGEYAALFYDTKKWHCLQNGTFWLSETPDTISIGWDAALERICTYALLENKHNKQQVWALNAHFDHMGKLARENTAKLLLRKIDNLQKQTPCPAVLMGDFNSVPEATPIVLLSKVLSGSFTKAPDKKAVATFNNFDLQNQPKYCIDYIFTKDLDISKYEILTEKRKNGHYISDHFPVICEFKVTK